MEYRPSMASRRGAQVRAAFNPAFDGRANPDTEALLKEIDDLKRENRERKETNAARMAKARSARGRKKRASA